MELLDQVREIIQDEIRKLSIPTKEFLTIEEVSYATSIGKTKIRESIKSRNIPTYRNGTLLRIKREDIHLFFDKV